MARLAGLIFDVDGTLAETERDGHRIAFNQAFAEHGLDWDWTVDLYGELLAVTGGRERILAYIERYQPPIDEPAEALAARLHATKTRHYVALVEKQGIAFRPGVTRLIREAREAGLKLAIATTTSQANVEALFARLPAPLDADWFDARICAEQAPVKKPDPQAYLYALQALGLDAGQCLAIEDSPPGLKAAKAASLRTLITRSEYTREKDFTGADWVIDDLEHAAADQPVTVGLLREWFSAGGG